MGEYETYLDEDRLPVFATVAATYRCVVSNIGALVKIAWLPMLLVAGLSFLNLQYTLGVLENPALPSSFDIARQFVTNVALALVFVPFATAWHRRAILREDLSSTVIGVKAGAAELKYCIYGIAVSVLALLVAAALSVLVGVVSSVAQSQALAWIGSLAVFVTCVFIFIRLCLIFPAAAISAPARLKDSWRATSGSVWRIFFVYLFAHLPVIVVGFLVQFNFFGAEAVQHAIDGGVESLKSLFYLGWVFNLILYPVAIAVSVGCLSMIFKFLTAKDHPE